MHWVFRFLVYLVVIAGLFYYRFKLDSPGPNFISSDGAIKFYQSVQYVHQGVLDPLCFYPGKEIDPDYKFFPFDYPFVRLKDSSCIFQYPQFFSWIGSLLIRFLGNSTIMYFAIFVHVFCMILSDRFLKMHGLGKSEVLFSTIVIFLSFPLLTVLDFSEMSLYHFTWMLGIYFIMKEFQNQNKNLMNFFWGCFLFSFSITLRYEVGLLFILFVIFYIHKFFPLSKNLKSIFISGIGFILPLSILFIFNYIISGNPLGYRFLSQFDNNKVSMGFLEHFKFAKAYIFGDEVMKGFLTASPVSLVFLFILFPKIRNKINSDSIRFILAGVLYIIISSLSVTVYGGVNYFGLRYLEPGFIILGFGISIGFLPLLFDMARTKLFKSIVIILLFASMQPSYVFVKDAMKGLYNASRLYMQIQEKFYSLGNNDYIIHTSLNTAYLIGYSFVDKKHILVYKKEDIPVVEDRIIKLNPNAKILILSTPGNHYISKDIPEKSIPKYKSFFEPEFTRFKLKKKEIFYNYNFNLYETN